MAYSIISSEKTNTGNLYHFKGTSSDTKPTGKWVGENSEFIELDTGDTYFYDNPTAGWVKKIGDSGGSSSGGSYTLPTASADTKGGVKIGSGLTMTGEVLSATGGGGAEKFVVTITEVAEPGEDAYYTADKTIAEIVAADAANQIVVASVPFEGLSVEVPCILAVDDSFAACIFSCTVTPELSSVVFVSVIGNEHDGSDNWEVRFLDKRDVPSYSSSNNGQVLGVSSGDLTWVDSNAPLIVNMTIDQNDQTKLVGDKTFGEIATAIYGGKRAVIKVDIEGAAQSCAQIIDCFSVFDNGSVASYAITCSQLVSGTATLATISGSANEHPAVSIA